MARAMWKADLELGEIRVAVKLYAAVEDRQVHFRLLHAADHTPVQQAMVDPTSGEPVPREQIRRAVKLDRGLIVVLQPDEQAALEPKPSRSITVERIVDADKVDERWFDRPYYLGPDGNDDGYFALACVLEDRAWIGIAHWVMRKKSYAGALYARDGYLLLDTLRSAGQVVELEGLEPAGPTPNPREIQLAEQLLGTLADRFDPAAYRDEYRERVLAMLDAKAKGKVVRFPKAARRKKSDSLIDDLTASLKAGRRAGHGR